LLTPFLCSHKINISGTSYSFIYVLFGGSKGLEYADIVTAIIEQPWNTQNEGTFNDSAAIYQLP